MPCFCRTAEGHVERTRIQLQRAGWSEPLSGVVSQCLLYEAGRTLEARMSTEEDERNLNLVQRIIVSALVVVVFGSFSAVLAAYVAIRSDVLVRGDAIGLWVMTGVIGLLTAAAVLVINQRRPYSPWVVLGLVPLAISGYWLFS